MFIHTLSLPPAAAPLEAGHDKTELGPLNQSFPEMVDNILRFPGDLIFCVKEVLKSSFASSGSMFNF